MKLIIGNKNYSSWSLRAWLLPAVHDIPFEEIRVTLSQPGTSSEIAQYSAAGKVPVLYDGGLFVWDSLAICEYISEKYLAGAGWPEDITMRAEARSYSAEMHSGFFAVRQKMPMNCRALDRSVPLTAELQKEIERIDSSWSMLRQKYGESGPWLFGRFSIADCMFAPVVMRFNTYGVVVSESSKAYMETMLLEPKIQLWVDQAAAEEEIIAEEEVGNVSSSDTKNREEV
ncbi:MAG: glutathione S-transferase family protein [Desulfopila sp.]|jgi:glutathione S-transferase|nr:glutathione S-transferase family protein [Desulfopila sp.]